MVVDGRAGALPSEPTTHRRAVVVEDHTLFPDDYPNILVVALTHDQGLAHGSLAERIDPTGDNRVEATCWALSHHVTSVSLRRIQPTGARITAAQLASIRTRITWAIGTAQP